MSPEPSDDPVHIAFAGDRRLAEGDLVTVALAARAAAQDGGLVLVFDSAGRVQDLDLRGDEAAVRERLTAQQAPDQPRRGPGRPKLGVASREVTLLPRQWDWLAAQPGGASATLRRLVDEARRGGEARERPRLAREAAYRFMTAMAGDRPGYEEATRALFAGDAARFEAETTPWPADIRDHVRRLAQAGLD